jgi:hypothetical protein
MRMASFVPCVLEGPITAVCGSTPVLIADMVQDVPPDTVYEVLLPLNLLRTPRQRLCLTMSAPTQIEETSGDESVTVTAVLELFKGREPVGTPLSTSLYVVSNRVGSMTPVMVQTVTHGQYTVRLSFVVNGGGVVRASGLLNATAVVTRFSAP